MLNSDTNAQQPTKAGMAQNPLLGAVFLLWAGDSYVERDGSTEPDKLIGVFTSLDEMNKCLDERWFEMPLDTRGKKFTADVRRYEVERKYGNSSYCYYEQRELNCA